LADRERIVAIYRVRCEKTQIEARAGALAAEQSVEMPLHAVRSAWVRDEIVGRVDAIDATDDGWRVSLSLSPRTVGSDPGQLLNMLFGNSSLQPDVELIDARLPDSLVAALPGPAFGIDGLRELVGASGRALTCTALKPQGLPPSELAELAYVFARAGIDLIKDDHGIADQQYSRFDERVALIQDAVQRANRETGGRSAYAPSLSGGPTRLADQLRSAHRAGVRCVLACPMLLGAGAFAEVVRGHGGLAILAHPALAGASRIAPALLLGRLFRLFGADATIFPNFGGRFSYSRETCREIAQAAREPLGGHRPALPVPAGGMSVERVDEMLGEFGADVMLLIGGNLLEAGDAMPQRARDFVARVRAAGDAAPRARRTAH
jgi:ribulose-bisphosphate carboxylase large chain